MSRSATSFVLGYHGCDSRVAHGAISGDIDLLQSDRDYDWLGPGAYFWEADPQRALEWADWKVGRGDYRDAAVVGAVIDLRHCLDLLSREDLELVSAAHASLVAMQVRAGLPIPVNRSVDDGSDRDRTLRFLDCAVIRHLHQVLDEQAQETGAVASFDTVRGMFVEGEPLYAGSGFRRKTHVQIAVRNAACIRGLFIPRA